MEPVVHSIPKKYESNLYSNSNMLTTSSLFEQNVNVKSPESLAHKNKNKDSITTLLSSLE